MEKSTKIRSLLYFLENFSKIFSPVSKAEFSPLSIPYDLLTLHYSLPNLKENISTQLYKQFLLPKASQDPLIHRLTPLGLSSIPSHITSISPRRTYKAIIQSFNDKSGKKRSTLEIYKENSLISSLNLDDFHEDVMNNMMVGTPLVWSENEEKFLYIAKLKRAKHIDYFDSYNEMTEKEITQAHQAYVYESDYGEKFNGVIRTTIFIYDLKANQLNQMILPYDKIFPTNPAFLDVEGKEIMFCGILPEPVKVGILYCLNRPSKLYYEANPKLKKLYPSTQSKEPSNDYEEPIIDLKDLHVLQESITHETCIKPFISPNRKKIAYFATPLKPPHVNTLALHVYDLETKKDLCVMPIIDNNVFFNRKPEEINKNLEVFSGICGGHELLEKSYWLNDSKHLIFQSIAGCGIEIFLVNTETSELTNISMDDIRLRSASAILLSKPNQYNMDNLVNDSMIIGFDSMQNGGFSKIAIMRNLTELIKNNTPIQNINPKAKWTILDLNENKPDLQNSIESLFQSKFREKTMKFGKAEGLFWSLEGYDSFSVEFSHFFPLEAMPSSVSSLNKQKPLIVLVHGGPHSNFAGFVKMRLFLLLRGYNLLLPNFTGSCGYGQKYIEDLMEKIGEIDVEEIMGMTHEIIAEKLCDPEKIIIMGGSYGGYLAGILATHPIHSKTFKAAIMRNPVVNIPYMHGITDIPEWCPAVTLGKGIKEWHFTGDEVKRMYELSPIAGHCRIPVLLMLGEKDRRVPYQGGLAFRNKVLAEGGVIDTMVYPEGEHALEESVKIEYDNHVKILSFISNILNN